VFLVRGVLQVCATADLSQFDGVVVVGGDGLFNEALNGLLRTNWTHLRVGLIPAGSTNTIVCR
jgi:diacylglycerol kinase family enzyme